MLKLYHIIIIKYCLLFVILKITFSFKNAMLICKFSLRKIIKENIHADLELKS